ncbi:acyl-CoA N-acyltransferase [Hypoxylon sp. NC1633]|nr:acyl-CoA N-acyltransferase [Hypoxylon sp. NC1633]
MAPLKRKRPHDVASEIEETVPAAPRRATRRHPTTTDEPEYQLRSGRVRARTNEKQKQSLVYTGAAPRRKNDATKTISRLPTKHGRGTRHVATREKIFKENIQPEDDDENDEDDDDIDELQEEEERLLRERRAALRPTETPTKKSTPTRPTIADIPPIPPPTPHSDRNVDKVMLGRTTFKAWYPSYYGKEVLGSIPNNASSVGAKDNSTGGAGAIMNKMGGGSKRTALPQPLLDILYVCPLCFKYSRELDSYHEHTLCCSATFEMPGCKVYTHPKGQPPQIKGVSAKETVGEYVAKLMAKVIAEARATATATNAEGRPRKEKEKRDDVVPRAKAKANADADADGVAPLGENLMATQEGEWSVWEVDGEKDALFCQNLSLFAKLFLDNKSVFFDVSGFNYFLLVYTPPSEPPSSHHTAPSQVVGFFSKEKLSWDNNNVACILVFPPWQRKGLGALLMGVSYEISRRERVLGGPEKPISDLGRRGYKRFWAGEIARWLLDLDVTTEGNEGRGKETLLSIDAISQGTWIAPDDCLAVLRDMGIVEDAGLGLPADAEVGGGIKQLDVAEDEDGDGDGDESDVVKDKAKDKDAPRMPRVRLDKEALRRWVRDHRVDLTRTCDPDGFVEGYAVRVESDTDET